jgi:hypothetical protein
MTTEPPGAPDPTPAQEPVATTPVAPQAASSPLSSMSGERMVMIAGVVVVGVFLIFGLIADEWYPPFESVVVGSFAILLPLLGPEPVGSRISTGTLMTVAGYWLAIAGLWDFIGDIRFGWGGAEDVIASLLLAAAAAIAFLGARSIKA